MNRIYSQDSASKGSNMANNSVVRQSSTAAQQGILTPRHRSNVQRFLSHPVNSRAVVPNSVTVATAATGSSTPATSPRMEPTFKARSSSAGSRAAGRTLPVQVLPSQAGARQPSTPSLAVRPPPVQLISPRTRAGSVSDNVNCSYEASNLIAAAPSSIMVRPPGSASPGPPVADAPCTASPGSNSIVAPMGSPVTGSTGSVQASKMRSWSPAERSRLSVSSYSYTPSVPGQASPRAPSWTPVANMSPRCARAGMPAVTRPMMFRPAPGVQGQGTDSSPMRHRPERTPPGSPRVPCQRGATPIAPLIDGLMTAPPTVARGSPGHTQLRHTVPASSPGYVIPALRLSAVPSVTPQWSNCSPRSEPPSVLWANSSPRSEPPSVATTPAPPPPRPSTARHALPDARAYPPAGHLAELSDSPSRTVTLASEFSNTALDGAEAVEPSPASVATVLHDAEFLVERSPAVTVIEEQDGWNGEAEDALSVPQPHASANANHTPQLSSVSSNSQATLEEVLKRKENLAERVLAVERAVYEIENDLLWTGGDALPASKSGQAGQDAGAEADVSTASAFDQSDINGPSLSMSKDTEAFPQWFMRDLQVSLGKKEEAAAEAAKRAAAEAEAAAEKRMQLQAQLFARREEEMRAREESSARQVDQLTRQLAALQEEMTTMARVQQEMAEAQNLPYNELEVSNGDPHDLQGNVRFYDGQDLRLQKPIGIAYLQERGPIVEGWVCDPPAAINEQLREHGLAAVKYVNVEGNRAAFTHYGAQLHRHGAHSVDGGTGGADGQSQAVESICLNSRSPSIIGRSPEGSPMFPQSRSPSAGMRTPVSGIRRLSPSHGFGNAVVVSGGSGGAGGGAGSTGSATMMSWSPTAGTPSDRGCSHMTPCGSARMLPPDTTAWSLMPIKEVHSPTGKSRPIWAIATVPYLQMSGDTRPEAQ